MRRKNEHLCSVHLLPGCPRCRKQIQIANLKKARQKSHELAIERNREREKRIAEKYPNV